LYLWYAADHGHNIGSYFLSQMGSLEHNLHALFLVMPLGFLDAHPKAHAAIQANAQAPFTRWDVYAT
jgi:hypothetical protein